MLKAEAICPNHHPKQTSNKIIMQINPILVLSLALMTSSMLAEGFAIPEGRAVKKWYLGPTCCKAGRSCKYNNVDKCCKCSDDSASQGVMKLIVRGVRQAASPLSNL